MSDMEGKVTRVGASERGQRTSLKTPRYGGKAKSIYKTSSSVLSVASNARLDYWRSKHREWKDHKTQVEEHEVKRERSGR